MQIQEKILLAPYTSFKIGGKARFFGVVKNIEDLKEGVSFAKQKSLPLFILGGGSNILISDDGFRGLVLKIEIKDLVVGELGGGEVEVIVGAGVILDKLIEEITRRKLWGMENLSYIPGTVGAGAVQNCGAFGREVKDIILWVEIFDVDTGEIQKLQNKECQFSYRNSIFKQNPSWVVIRVAFRLETLNKEILDRFAIAREDGRGKTSPVTIVKQSSLRGSMTKQSSKFNLEYLGLKDLKSMENLTPLIIRNKIIEIRKKRTPRIDSFGSAGSFFKNPVISKKEFKILKEKFPEFPYFEEGEKIKIPIAWFLDKFGWKGYSDGEVGVYNKHALVLINKEKGTCKEIKNLAKKISDDVFEKTGLILETEVVFV